MKLSIILSLLALTSSISALPQPLSEVQRQDVAIISTRDAREAEFGNAEIRDLWKRKGGGGSGRPGGTSGGGGSSSGGGGSSGSGGSSTGGGSGLRPGSTGGTSSGGSGVRPTYGGRPGGSGPVYGGGAIVPYSSGARTLTGITPFFIGGALGAAVFFPGLWLYGVYSYPYVHPWVFHNATTNTNQTKPVQCLCEQYQECGCEENTDPTYQAAILGDGSYNSLNRTLVNVADANGTSTIFINGTLPNGTTADSGSGAGSIGQNMMQASGYWVMVALVSCAVFWS